MYLIFLWDFLWLIWTKKWALVQAVPTYVILSDYVVILIDCPAKGEDMLGWAVTCIDYSSSFSICL